MIQDPRSFRAVRTDRWDEGAIVEMRATIPAMDGIAESLSELTVTAGDLVSDCAAALNKFYPRVNKPEAVRDDRQVNLALVQDIMADPRYEELHDLCMADNIGTAFTVVSWEPWLREMLERMQEQQKLQEKLQEARDKLRDMQNQAQQPKEKEEDGSTEPQDSGQNTDQSQDNGDGDESDEPGDKDQPTDAGADIQAGDRPGDQPGDGQTSGGDAQPTPGSNSPGDGDGSSSGNQGDNGPNQTNASGGNGPGSDSGNGSDLDELIQAIAAQQELVDDLADDAARSMEVMDLANAANVAEMVEQAAEDRGAEHALAQSCGYGHDEIHKIPFEDREKLRALGAREDFKKFADFFGAYRNYVSPASHKSPDVMEELVGLTKGSAIDRLTQDQLAMLGHPALKPIVLRDLLNSEASVYEYEGDTETGGGGCVVCVDESSSVRHFNPAIKAFVANLAILFKKEQRPFHVIHFDSAGWPRANWPGYQEQYFHQTGISEITELMETFLGGGTEFIPPLERATEFIERNCFHTEAVNDILIITDGEPADLSRGPTSQAWIDKLHERLDKADAVIWGLAVGRGGSSWSLQQLTQGRLVLIEDFEGSKADPLRKIINGIQKHRKVKKGKAA